MMPPYLCKLATLVVVLVLLAALTSTRVVASSDDNGRHRVLQDGEDCKSFIFRYTSQEGKEFAATLDENGELDHDIPEYSIAAITACGEELALIQQLLANGAIEAAELDLPKRIPPNEDREEYVERDEGEDGRKLLEVVPYGIVLVQADQLWDLEPPASSVKVCVVDTGIQDGHIDLPNSVQDSVTGTNGFILTEVFGTWQDDGNGHGTHCAGVIGAIGDNGRGVVGVRKNPATFSFHIGKGLSDEGAGATSNIIEAIQGCVNAGAKVISMSLGGEAASDIENEYYNYLYDQNILIVAAAGNEGNSAKSFPASYKAVMSVAAVDENEQWADFSQYNEQVEIAAPGVRVLSSVPKDAYAFLSGTSMATPHVAGVAAEVWSHFPDCTNNQIRNVLIRTAKDLGDSGWDQKNGYGLVQGRAAYDLLKEQGCQAGGPVTDPLVDGAIGGCGQVSDIPCNPTSGGVQQSQYSFHVVLGLGITMFIVVMS